MMKRLSLLLTAMLVMASVSFAQERREQPTPEQIQAYLSTLTSHPDQHIIAPDLEATKESPCRGTKNYGKRIAVFGGSLSVNKESDAAKQM